MAVFPGSTGAAYRFFATRRAVNTSAGDISVHEADTIGVSEN